MGDVPKLPLTHEEALKLCGENPEAKEFIMQQTMYRIKDPKKSLPFYTEILGMKLLTKLDFPNGKFSLYFMGFEDEVPGELGSSSRTEWTLTKKGTIELTHNWGTEDDPSFSYHNGNKDPRGYGHIGIAVPDVYKACERFENYNVNFVKRPDDGVMKGLAFITDPDGYWIEIFKAKSVSNL